MNGDGYTPRQRAANLGAVMPQTLGLGMAPPSRFDDGTAAGGDSDGRRCGGLAGFLGGLVVPGLVLAVTASAARRLPAVAPQLEPTL